MNFSEAYLVQIFGRNISRQELCQSISIKWNLTFLQLPEQCRPVSYDKVPLIVISTVLTLLSVGTCIDNCLMISAVALVKKLRTPCNMLILNLAVTDLLVGTLVIPFASIYQIKGYWIFDEIVCDIFILFDVLLCTSSILNLCAISVDRYLVITQPFKYAVKRTRKRMLCMILLVWTASGLISIPPLFGWRQKRHPYTCDYSEDLGYQIYATFIAFYLPLVVMLVLYGRIFRLAKAMVAAEIKNKINTDCSESITTSVSRRGSFTDDGEDTTTKGTLQVVGDFFKPISRRLSFRINTDNSNTIYNPVYDEMGLSPKKNVFFNRRSSDVSKTSLGNVNNKRRQVNPMDVPIIQIDYTGIKDENQNSEYLQNKPMQNFHKPQKASVEAKAVRTLGIIMGCFTICWLPFFLMQILFPILKMLNIEYSNGATNICFQIFYWLGYTNSFLNPLIYAKFNREFRRPFCQILMCHCRHINAHLRSETYNDQYGTNSSRQKASQHRLSTTYTSIPPISRNGRMSRTRRSTSILSDCECTNSTPSKCTNQSHLLIP